jgi:general secretion pathway protein G
MKRKWSGSSWRSQTGFTLVELLLIMVILGILASTVVFALSGTASSAASSACNTDVKTVETALEAFHNNLGNTADSGNYPNASTATPSGNSQLLAPASSNYGGPYLRTWPSSTHYTITLGTSGHVLVDGKDYDASATNPCSTVS